MDLYQFTNNGKAQLAAGINNSVTTLSVKSGEGAKFPALTGSKYFMCTLVDSSGNREIIKVTARTADSFDTIVRAQEGTGARAFSTDDKVELRVTAGFFEAIVAALSDGYDLNGGELVLDADGDSSLHASIDDQVDLKLGGNDKLHFKVAAVEPETDNAFDLGAAGKEFKDAFIDGVAYIDEYDIEGTYKCSFPTNGVGAHAKYMMGLNTTILWMYLNIAPPGWKVTTDGADTVLGVKATAKSSGTADNDNASKLEDTGADFVSDGVVEGDVAYNLDDDTSGLITNVAATILTLDSDAFPDGDEQYEVGTKFIDPGGNQADKGSWVPAPHTLIIAEIPVHKHPLQKRVGSGGVTGINSIDGGSSVSPNETAIDNTGGDGAHSHGDNTIRPATSLGRLFQLDSA